MCKTKMLWPPPPTIVIDSDELIEQFKHIIFDAEVVGIDAEWSPELTRKTPSATIVQLACWSVTHGLQVLILDFLAVAAASIAATLQRFFRNSATIKTGYALGGDLSAISTALGARGPGCVAVVTPVIEIGTVHRHLSHHHFPGIDRPRQAGLSSIVEAQLGKPLDKSQQCSAWGERPLTSAQLQYAALDVFCLLALLDDLIGHWEAHHKQSARNDGEEEEEKKESDREDREEEVSGSHHGLEDHKEPADFVFKWKLESLRAAGGAWGQRWEYKGGKIQRTGGGVGAALNKASSSTTRTLCGRKVPPPSHSHKGTLPRHIPWMDASSQCITSTPRFLTDVMLHGLARQLRLWGVDAEALDPTPKFQRHLAHRALVERSEDEDRVILTRDAIFMHRGLSDRAYFVTADVKQAQLEEIVTVFRLPVGETALLSRCSRCNGEFWPKPWTSKELPPGHDVPPGVVDRGVEEFWVCRRCRAVYWQGSMYVNAIARLTERLNVLDLSRTDSVDAHADYVNGGPAEGGVDLNAAAVRSS